MLHYAIFIIDASNEYLIHLLFLSIIIRKGNVMRNIKHVKKHKQYKRCGMHSFLCPCHDGYGIRKYIILVPGSWRWRLGDYHLRPHFYIASLYITSPYIASLFYIIYKFQENCS